jgi:hypothetical protein
MYNHELISKLENLTKSEIRYIDFSERDDYEKLYFRATQIEKLLLDKEFQINSYATNGSSGYGYSKFVDFSSFKPYGFQILEETGKKVPSWVCVLFDFLLTKEGEIDWSFIHDFKKVINVTSRQVGKTDLVTVLQILLASEPKTHVLTGFKNIDYFSSVFRPKFRKYLPAINLSPSEKVKAMKPYLDKSSKNSSSRYSLEEYEHEQAIIANPRECFNLPSNPSVTLFPNFSTLNYLGLDTQNAPGRSEISAMFIDEAQAVKNVDELIRQLAPIMNAKSGSIFYTGTAEAGWFNSTYKHARQEMLNGNPKFLAFSFTLFNAGVYTEKKCFEIIDDMYQQYIASGNEKSKAIAKIAQEYFNYFPPEDETNGLVYPIFNSRRDSIVIDDTVLDEPMEGWKYYLTLDKGTTIDPTAILLTGTSEDNQAIIINEYKGHDPLDEIVEWVESEVIDKGFVINKSWIDKQTNAKTMYLNRDQFYREIDVINEYFDKLGITFEPAIKSVIEKRINNIEYMFKPGAELYDLSKPDILHMVLYGDFETTRKVLEKYNNNSSGNGLFGGSQIFISAKCMMLLDELTKLRWDGKKSSGIKKFGNKADNHLSDAFNYVMDMLVLEGDLDMYTRRVST